MASASASQPIERVGLLCRSSGKAVVIPAERVGQIVEVEVIGPLPTASQYIGGLAAVGTRILVSIRLGQGRPAHFTTKAVVLRDDETPTQWCVEVDEIEAFTKVDLGDEAAALPLESSQPRWLSRGVTPGGAVVDWLDVVALNRRVSGAP